MNRLNISYIRFPIIDPIGREPEYVAVANGLIQSHLVNTMIFLEY